MTTLAQNIPPGFIAVEDPAPGGKGFIALIGPLYRKDGGHGRPARWGFLAEGRRSEERRVGKECRL